MNHEDMRKKQQGLALSLEGRPSRVARDGPESVPEMDIDTKRAVDAYDALVAAWDEAEKRFLLLRLPLPAFVKFGDSELGWDRFAGKWRIVVKQGEDVKPIADHKMTVRIEAVPYLGPLRKLLLEKRREFIPQVMAAVDSLKVQLEGTDENED